MEITTLQVGTFEVNCSVLSENGMAWIVDPGQEPERILALLAEKGLSPAAILLTHAHFDHIGAVPALRLAFPDLPVYVHPNDAKVFAHPLNQLPPDYPPVSLPSRVADPSGLVSVPGLPSARLRVLETPGHTPGGVCYFFPDFFPHPLLLSGDTLFAGSIGRTDLPGGDMATLMDSLAKLKELPDDTLVIPGHGSRTTIAAERSGNPFLL